jgi:uncharacterized protein (DUF362 family)
MKALFVMILAVLALTLVAVPPALAQEGGCSHDETTVASLHHCVQHALAEGHIDNAGVAQSLLAKLNSAQAALERGQTKVAVNKLEAFIQEVAAQSGKHIVAEHAGHLLEHTRHVLEALED